MNHDDIGAMIADDLEAITIPPRETNEFVAKVGSRIYRHWIPDRVKFAFDSPPKFATENRATDEIFLRLLDYLVVTGPTITDSALTNLVVKFTTNCTREVWEQRYQPVLQRKPFPGVTTNMFCEWLTDCVGLSMMRPATRKDRIGMGLTEVPGVLYPIAEDSDHVVIVVWADSITVYAMDYSDILGHFTAQIAPHFAQMLGQSDLEYPILIDAVVYGGSANSFIELVDMVPQSKQKQWPGAFRYTILLEMFDRFFADNSRFCLADGYPLDSTSKVDAAVKHFQDAYPGATITAGLFVIDDRPYENSTLLVPLLPA